MLAKYSILSGGFFQIVLFSKLAIITISVYNRIYLLLTVAGLHRCSGFCLVAASGGCSVLAACGLLVVVASLAVGYLLRRQ